MRGLIAVWVLCAAGFVLVYLLPRPPESLPSFDELMRRDRVTVGWVTLRLRELDDAAKGRARR